MKLIRETSPYIRRKANVSRMMLDVLIALLPVVVFAIIQNKMKAVSVILISVISMVLFELLCTMVIKWPEGMKIKELFTKEGFKKLYSKYTINNILAPLISGIIYAMILPAGTNWYVVLVGSAVGMVIGKMLFGGLGSNIFNPAAVGRVFVGLCFGSQLVYPGIDAFTGGTPLGMLADGLLNINKAIGSYSILDLFLGKVPGSMGEVSALLILVGAGYLFARRSADFRPCVSMIGSFAIITLVVSLVAANSTVFTAIDSLKLFAYEILSGGLLFGAVFMVTDPVTSPTTKVGRIFYGVVVGSLTALIRYAGAYPEGVAFSILIANMFVPVIDHFLLGNNNKYNWKHAVGLVASLSVVCLILGATVSRKTDNTYNLVKSEMFKNYSGLQSEVALPPNDNLLNKKVVAKNAFGKQVGYVYEAVYSYDNPYGGTDKYTALIGVNNNYELVGIKITGVKHNSWEDAAGVIEQYVNNTYFDGMSLTDVNNVDLTGGATGIAGFVQKMVVAAIGDAQGSTPVKEDRDLAIIKNIYSNIDTQNSEFIKDYNADEAVQMKVVVRDQSGALLGHVYKVSGKNTYGPLVLFVAIDENGKLVAIEFAKNGQTGGRGPMIKEHVDSYYTAGLGAADIDNIDDAAGATYSSELAKELVKAAFAEHNGGAQ